MRNFNVEKVIAKNQDQLNIDWNAFSESYQNAIAVNNLWLRNDLLNKLECNYQLPWLSSFPTSMAIPFTNYCNASCIFCLSQNIECSSNLNEEYLERFLKPALPYVKKLEVGGNGEPTVHFQCHELIESLLSSLAKQATFHLITNGINLDRELIKILVLYSSEYIQISLNAADKKTYQKIMGVDGFDKVLSNIKDLYQMKKKAGTKYPSIVLSFVANSYNIYQVDEFLALAALLKVDGVNISPLSQIDKLLIEPLKYESYHGGVLCDEYRESLNYYEQLLPDPKTAERVALHLSDLRKKGRFHFRLCFNEKNFIQKKLVVKPSNIDKKAFKLLCTKPWTDFNIYLIEPFHAAFCCHTPDIQGPDVSDFSNFWNSDFMMRTRHNFRLGRVPSKCLSKCGHST